MRKESFIRGSLLVLSYSVAAASLYEAQRENLEGFTSILGSSDDPSSSSSSDSSESSSGTCWDNVKPWESYGGFVLYFLLMCYIFVGFELICGAFFVPALAVFCERLHLPDDFAGATLMALGGNAPDIFSGVIGVLVLRTDVGAGTIVGSLLFNHLCIIGFTVLTIGKIKLEMKSVSREMIFYFISIVIFTESLLDEWVTLSESTVYLSTYVIYVLVCWFTPHITRLFSRCGCSDSPKEDLDNVVVQQEKGEDAPVEEAARDFSVNETTPDFSVNETTPLMLGETEKQTSEDARDAPVETAAGKKEESEEDEKYESLFAVPHNAGAIKKFLWVLSLPYAVLFTITIPDVRRKRCRKMYMITFLIVLVWLAIMAYAMVYGADNFARCLCIPEDVMGLTITGIGASLPSMFSSVIAAKRGLANMAISNAFGSNLCSILLALGIPIFVHDLVIGPYPCKSDAILSSSVILLVALLIFIVIAACSRFTLYRVHGVILLLLYICLLGVAVTFGVLDIDPFAFLNHHRRHSSSSSA